MGGVRGPNGAGAVGVTVVSGGGGCPDGCLDLDVLLERRGGSFDWPLPEEFFLQPKMKKKAFRFLSWFWTAVKFGHIRNHKSLKKFRLREFDQN